MRLELSVDGKLAGWGEIRDLGRNIAGLGGFGTAEEHRGEGIYWLLMDWANKLVDVNGYDAAAVRIMGPYVRTYLTRYPRFRVVKENDEEGADWLLRLLRVVDPTALVDHLEENVKKW